MLTVTDPKLMASQFADDYIAGANELLKKQIDRTSTQSKALTSLGNTLDAFHKAMADLVAGGSMAQTTVTLSDPGFASVTSTSGAKPGTYKFHVSQLATANQQAIDLPDSIDATGAGKLKLTLGDGTEVVIDIEAADKDGSGQVSPEELARAINANPDTDGKVRAEIVGGKLVLSATEVGAASQIKLDTSGIANSELRDRFDNATEISKAQDAIIWLGDEGVGVKIEQASNTLDSIEGLSIVFTKAGASGTVTVGSDKDATVKGVQAFVDAYNTLMKALADLTRAGDANNGDAGGPFSADAGVRALMGKINSALRKSVAGINLYSLGIDTDRKGMLSINEKALEKAMKDQPEALDMLFGNKSTGLIGNLESALDGWLNSSKGQLKSRKESIQKAEKTLDSKSNELQRRYDGVRKRYEDQFTRLQVMQMQMESTLNQIKNLFSTSKD
ncbi:hypothetical protein WL88_28930 [Burkholderia diffusa]|uniref:Flagellar hook-associated protein 2 n=1 Tax=Burkholderia diffusa TaxID=488732 RepID=A0AAW3P7I4_9BURK|nr:flagellar filament capping protein FliD [Burkholderia diffusa]KWF41373.1 hypothetical protein WL85_00125 [Burkholderia diffusa]KWF44199.1 hypothetical protein WL86_08560 [Burkholderia diffusa]KWF45107.1 hypothetical protein WL88_28930 [Burkholderia diffusa]KWF51090.1 hypothetical protein WL87_14575 [Burkholderia diffusa]